MSAKRHTYSVQVQWTGNDGAGTSAYAGYRRDHTVSAPGKPPLHGSSDPAFRGDPARYNPEELLVASLSACHMLWYLHLCAENHIVVEAYSDQAVGTMEESFVSVTLRPAVRISAGDSERALALHHEAHGLCYIARSVNFPVQVEPYLLSR